MGLCWAILFASFAFGQGRFEHLSLNEAPETIEADVKKADLIFVGKMSSTGPPPASERRIRGNSGNSV